MSKTPVSTLQEFSVKQMWGVPEYTLISSRAETHKNSFTYRVVCKTMSATGTAMTKKDAKHAAAKALLRSLSPDGANIVGALKSSNGLIQKIDSYYLPGSSEVSLDDIFVNSVGKLNEYCAMRKLKPPDYKDLPKIGPAHAPLFTVICEIGPLQARANANSKKKAKHDAAQAMLDQLVRNGDYVPNQSVQDYSVNGIEQKMKEINFLDLKIEEPSVTKDDSSKRAKKLYPKLEHYSGIKKVSNDISINDYHNAFKNFYDPIICESVCRYLGQDSPLGLMNNERLSNITSLLGLNVEYDILLNEQNCVIVTCKLNSSPIIMDMGMGSTYLDARDQAIANILDSVAIFFK